MQLYYTHVLSTGMVDAAAPTLNTSYGLVRGFRTGNISVFRGVRYANPPKRWHLPEPPTPWTGVIDGTVFAPPCVQLSTGQGAEDCLFLDIYSPSAAVAVGNAMLPVMTWIYGGSYSGGFSSAYDASALVEFLHARQLSTAVVVINHRLNIFGFLGSEDLRQFDDGSGSTGNYGLQDQREAMRWLRINAATFGGDPRRITIAGQSSGAGSVSTHLLLDRTQGLFDAAIAESAAFSPWSAQTLELSEVIYQQVLRNTKCEEVRCLFNKTTSELIDAARLSHPEAPRNGHVWLVWCPTIDNVELHDHPYLFVKHGRARPRVPVLHGTNLDEAGFFVNITKNATRQDVLHYWHARYGSLMGNHTAASMAELYLGNKTDYPSHTGTQEWWGAQRSLTDELYSCPARVASYGLTSSTVPIYQYLFRPITIPVVHHGAEVHYIFLKSTKDNPLQGANRSLAEAMAAAWANFAHSGKPIPVEPLTNMWPQFDHQLDGPYLQLDVRSHGGLTKAWAFREVPCKFIGEWISRALHA